MGTTQRQGAPTGGATPPDPMQDPQNREKVEAAREFGFQLLKGVKQIGMYRHNEAKFPEFLQKAHEALAQFHDRYGPLSLKVEGQNFTLLGQGVFSEDTPLAFKFYREGIRQLLLRPGLPIEELVTFTHVALSEPERGADEIIAQLWNASLEHVEYVVVEGFKMDEYSEEEVQVEVDQVVGYLYSRLKTDSADFVRFARLSGEDLEVRMEEVDQLRGAVITGVTASDELKAKIQKEIAEEEGQRLFPKLVSAVFQVVEGGVEDAEFLSEMFVQLLDALLLQEDFATINQLLLKLKAMEHRAGTHEGLARLRSTFVARMGEEQRLTRIGELLKSARPRSPADIQRYLQALDQQSVLTLLGVLETVEIPENRILLCDVLVPFAKTMPDPFVARLQAERPQTLRDMVYILEKANYPDRLKMYQQVLLHKNMAIRLEVLSIAARGRSGEARKLVETALADPVEQIRCHAYKLLPEFDRDKAYLELTRLLRDPSFEKRSTAEKQAIYAAIGITGTPGMLSLFQEQLAQKSSLFNKGRVQEDKLAAILVLQSACSIQAYRILQVVTEDKSQPLEILTAARRAMYVTRKALFGESAGPEA